MKTPRLATYEDVNSMLNIYNDAVQARISTADTKPIKLEQKQDEFKKNDIEKYPIWVQEYHEKIIGYICYKPYSNRDGFSKTSEISIYLDKNFQGQKLGQQFLEQALNEAPKLGFKNVVAYIFKDNEASIKLFKKFKFKEWGCLPSIACIDGVSKDLMILGYVVE